MTIQNKTKRKRLKGIIKENEEIENNILKPKYCNNCNESNVPNSQFCTNCKMILSYDAYTETLEKQNEKERDIKELKRSIAFLAAFSNNPPQPNSTSSG